MSVFPDPVFPRRVFMIDQLGQAVVLPAGTHRFPRRATCAAHIPGIAALPVRRDTPTGKGDRTSPRPQHTPPAALPPGPGAGGVVQTLFPDLIANRREFAVDSAGVAHVSYRPRTTRFVVAVTTIEGGRQVIRTAPFELPVASYLDRLEIRTNAGALVNVPLGYG